MYVLIDGCCFMLSIYGMVQSIIKSNFNIGVGSACAFLFYPLLLQSIYNLFTNLFTVMYKYDPQLNSRFVYDQQYNISFGGIEKFHPFDSQKYGNIVKILQQMNIINRKDLIKANNVPRSILLEKMSKIYLLKLAYTIPICKYIEMPLIFIPAFLLRWRVLNPMLKATEGTLIACQLASKVKWAINLSGGYHHASCQNGGGFCIYPDITLAVHYITSRLNYERIMIIDLDAHQGNGHQRDHMNNSNIFIIDCYNEFIYPGDQDAKKGIGLDLGVGSQIQDEEYLQYLKRIQISMKQFRPQFIIYNAGTDVLIGDSLGGMSLSEKCIIRRDEYIVGLAHCYNVPLVMVLSGGYQKTNAQVIANSIKNLIDKFGDQL